MQSSSSWSSYTFCNCDEPNFNSLLNLALKECKGQYREIGAERRGQPKLVTSSFCLLESYHVAAFLNFVLRLNGTQGLSALQVQDYSFVLLCVYWKTMETPLVIGEGDLNLTFLQGQAQRRFLPSICLIELLNCILSVREVSVNTSL